jgi:hypothetical protein
MLKNTYYFVSKAFSALFFLDFAPPSIEGKTNRRKFETKKVNLAKPNLNTTSMVKK